MLMIGGEMQNSTLDRKNKKFDYTYVIIALCFLTVCITLGFCSSPTSLYLVPVQNALNVDRTVLAFE